MFCSLLLKIQIQTYDVMKSLDSSPTRPYRLQKMSWKRPGGSSGLTLVYREELQNPGREKWTAHGYSVGKRRIYKPAGGSLITSFAGLFSEKQSSSLLVLMTHWQHLMNTHPMPCLGVGRLQAIRLEQGSNLSSTPRQLTPLNKPSLIILTYKTGTNNKEMEGVLPGVNELMCSCL